MTDNDNDNDAGPNRSVYHVQVIETDASIRCGLRPLVIYKLLINTNEIQLADEQKSIQFKWPYKHVRRYGYTTNSLSFEAGSKCITGEGLFIFRNKKSKQLYNQITANIDQIKKQHCRVENQNKESLKEQHQPQEQLNKIKNDRLPLNSNNRSMEDNERIPHLFINGCPYAQIFKQKKTIL